MWYLYYAGYGFVILGAIISLISSAWMKSTFTKYSKVPSMRGVPASEVAKTILNRAGVYNVGVESVRGSLTDHYDPRNGVLRLSDSTYQSSSVAAVGVAAHECGHCIQDAENYFPIKVRNVFVPVANVGSTLSWPMVFIGLLVGFEPLVSLGILMFGAVVVFQLITLPVEFNASRRAVRVLEDGGILSTDELNMTRKVLRAAAMTYVAAVAVSLLQLLRLLLLRRRR